MGERQWRDTKGRERKKYEEVLGRQHARMIRALELQFGAGTELKSRSDR